MGAPKETVVPHYTRASRSYLQNDRLTVGQGSHVSTGFIDAMQASKEGVTPVVGIFFALTIDLNLSTGRNHATPRE
jgi:hypothetical protein